MNGEFKDILDNFDSFYKSKILPKLAPIENRRKELLKQNKKFKILSLVVRFTFLYFLIAMLILFLLGSNANPPSDGAIYMLILFFVLVIGFAVSPIAFFVSTILKKMAYGMELVFAVELKNNILPVIFSPVGDFKVEQKPTDAIAYAYNKFFDIKSEMECIGVSFITEVEYTDDVIRGTFDDKEVLIAEGKLFKVCAIPYNKILMIKTCLEKNTTGKTVLKHKYSKNSIDVDGLDKIMLEDVNIMKKYDIYSNSQIESRYFLEPGFIDKINEIKKRIYAHSIDFILCENILYTIINSNHDYFELGSLYKYTADEWKFKNALKELYAIVKLINYFEL